MLILADALKDAGRDNDNLRRPSPFLNGIFITESAVGWFSWE
jgi:hypothetical protein